MGVGKKLAEANEMIEVVEVSLSDGLDVDVWLLEHGGEDKEARETQSHDAAETKPEKLW